jgi:hypothetical protein
MGSEGVIMEQESTMLNDFQQKNVWDGLLGAEIRAAYFAELSRKYQQTQKFLTLGTLLLSSGATIALLTTLVPANLNWVKPVLTLVAAGLSLWSLVSKNERNSIDCADLHFRWQRLADGYEILWSDVYAEDAVERLNILRLEEAQISKSSTSMPDDSRLMSACQDNVVMHHQAELVA